MDARRTNLLGLELLTSTRAGTMREWDRGSQALHTQE